MTERTNLHPAAAREIAVEAARPVEAQQLPLLEAAGLRLAQAVRADRDLPAADRSSRDGYAVKAQDLRNVPVTLRLTGEVAAGSAASPPVTAGACVRILTGANLPPGADTVVMVETTRGPEDDEVQFLEQPRPGQHLLRRGEDAQRGEVLLRPGDLLTPSRVALLVTVGQPRVSVRRRVRVGVLCTGTELRTAGDPVEAHQIRNSNGPGLLATLMERGGVEPVDLGIAADQPEATRQAVLGALDRVDLLLVTGGVSVGTYDLVPEALQRMGCEMLFHGVAQRPGKPTLLARASRGQLIFGLPGNPLSAFTAFHNLARPALDVMCGGDGGDPRPWPVRLLAPVRGGAARWRYVQATLEGSGPDGLPQARPIAGHSSANVVAGARADGAVVVPPGASLAAGELVELIPWRFRW